MEGASIEMTPLKVEILLHYYSSPNDFRDLDAPAIKEAIDEFVGLGIMNYLPMNEYKRKIGIEQDALDAYVTAILSVPLPKQKWIVEK